jgi:hypothetical protein
VAVPFRQGRKVLEEAVAEASEVIQSLPEQRSKAAMDEAKRLRAEMVAAGELPGVMPLLIKLALDRPPWKFVYFAVRCVMPHLQGLLAHVKELQMFIAVSSLPRELACQYQRVKGTTSGGRAQ